MAAAVYAVKIYQVLFFWYKELYLTILEEIMLDKALPEHGLTIVYSESAGTIGVIMQWSTSIWLLRLS